MRWYNIPDLFMSYPILLLSSSCPPITSSRLIRFLSQLLNFHLRIIWAYNFFLWHFSAVFINIFKSKKLFSPHLHESYYFVALGPHWRKLRRTERKNTNNVVKTDHHALPTMPTAEYIFRSTWNVKKKQFWWKPCTLVPTIEFQQIKNIYQWYPLSSVTLPSAQPMIRPSCT